MSGCSSGGKLASTSTQSGEFRHGDVSLSARRVGIRQPAQGAARVAPCARARDRERYCLQRAVLIEVRGPRYRIAACSGPAVREVPGRRRRIGARRVRGAGGREAHRPGQPGCGDGERRARSQGGSGGPGGRSVYRQGGLEGWPHRLRRCDLPHAGRRGRRRRTRRARAVGRARDDRGHAGRVRRGPRNGGDQVDRREPRHHDRVPGPGADARIAGCRRSAALDRPDRRGRLGRHRDGSDRRL